MRLKLLLAMPLMLITQSYAQSIIFPTDGGNHTATSTPLSISTDWGILNTTATSTDISITPPKEVNPVKLDKQEMNKQGRVYALNDRDLIGSVIVKMIKGNRVRFNDGQLIRKDKTKNELLTPQKQAINRKVGLLNKTLQKNNIKLMRYFNGLSEEVFDHWSEMGDHPRKGELHNLNNYYEIQYPEGTKFKAVRSCASSYVIT